MVAAHYEPLDHTGDLGWIVRGKSWVELLENASLALTDTLVDIQKVEETAEVQWEARGETRERILVRHLEEILFQLDARGLVFSRFAIELPAENTLKCRAWGEKLNRDKHGFKTEIKAITYHQLKIENPHPQEWRAQVILDV